MDKLTKDEIKLMLKNRTLPKHLREVFEEAKTWWYYNAKDVLTDTYHTRKMAIEGHV